MIENIKDVNLATFAMTVILAGIVAGCLDIFVASAIHQASPAVILRAIASGLYGREAYAGGIPMAAIGLVLQCVMSIMLATPLLAGALLYDEIAKRLLLAGGVYGLGVYAVMTFVVVPASRAWPAPDMSPRGVLYDLLAMILFGLVIAATPRAISYLAPHQQFGRSMRR